MEPVEMKKGLGILCQACLTCMHYGEYQTSNGALPRCELDNICLSIAALGRISDAPCPACRPLPQRG